MPNKHNTVMRTRTDSLYPVHMEEEETPYPFFANTLLCLQDILYLGHISCTLKLYVVLDHSLFSYGSQKPLTGFLDRWFNWRRAFGQCRICPQHWENLKGCLPRR